MKRDRLFDDLSRVLSGLCFAEPDGGAVAEAGAIEPVEPAAQPAEGQTTEPAAAAEPAQPAEPIEPKRKAWWDIRIAQLTDAKRAEQQAKEQLLRENEQLKALLSGPIEPKPADPAPKAPQAPVQPQDFTAAVEAAAAQKLAQERFQARADAIWEAGLKSHGDKFGQAVDTLNSAGVNSPEFLEAVMATDAPEAVIFKLGNEPEEAQRIAALPPLQRAVAMDRMARELAATGPKVSAAPAPVTPITSTRTTKAFDPADTSATDVATWIAEREKQVARKRETERAAFRH